MTRELERLDLPGVAASTVGSGQRVGAIAYTTEELRNGAVERVLVPDVDDGRAAHLTKKRRGVAAVRRESQDGTASPEVLVHLGGDLVVARRTLKHEQRVGLDAFPESVPIRNGWEQPDDVLEAEFAQIRAISVLRARRAQPDI